MACILDHRTPFDGSYKYPTARVSIDNYTVFSDDRVMLTPRGVYSQ